MSETWEEYEMEGIVVAIGGHGTNYWGGLHGDYSDSEGSCSSTW